MAWQVMEYMENNPGISMAKVIQHFAGEFEVDQQIHYLKNEVDDVMTIREKLRPLYGKKMDLEQQMALKESEFTMDVMTKYPPRKGSDKERKAYMDELKQADAAFVDMEKEQETVKEEIGELEREKEDVETRAKNARRLLETFNHYTAFLLESNRSTESIRYSTTEGGTANGDNLNAF